MENQQSVNKQQSVYDYLEGQTVAERKAFIKALVDNGISRQLIRNWISLRNGIPVAKQEVINKVAGQTLIYPKVKRVYMIEQD